MPKVKTKKDRPADHEVPSDGSDNDEVERRRPAEPKRETSDGTQLTKQERRDTILDLFNQLYASPSECKESSADYGVEARRLRDRDRILELQIIEKLNAINKENKDATKINGDELEILLSAVTAGNISLVREVLRKKMIHPNSRGRYYGVALLSAIRVHCFNTEKIVDLLVNGADLNFMDYKGNSTLQWAVRKGNACIVRTLLKHGADPNKRNDEGCATLHCTLGEVEDQRTQEEIMDLLIEGGADVNLKCQTGDSPLSFASYLGNARSVKKLIENKADPNQRNNDGYTALLGALIFTENDKSPKNIVDLLIEHGTDVKMTDKNGHSALHWASARNDVRIVQKLLDNGADIKLRTKYGAPPLQFAFVGHKALTNMPDVQPGSAANYAEFASLKIGPARHVQFCHDRSRIEALRETVDILLEYGSDVNPGLDSIIATPLELAIRSGDTYIVKKLLDSGANPNANKYPEHAIIWVLYANDQNKEEIFDLLVGYGADINLGNPPVKETPLHRACTIGDAWMVNFLIEKGAAIDKSNTYGTTPLHAALTSSLDQISLENVLEILLRKGADLNKRNPDGFTSLHLAALKVDTSIVKYLLEHGADPNTVSLEGNTPLHSAIYRNLRPMVDVLLEFGADVAMRNNHCESAASMLSILKAKSPNAAPSTYTYFNLFRTYVFYLSNDQHGHIREQRYDALVLRSMLEEFHHADDDSFLKTIEFTSEMLNEYLDGQNFMLTWLIYYSKEIDNLLISKKILFLLDQTEDCKGTGYQERNFLHLITSFLDKMFDGYRLTYKFDRLRYIIDKYANAAVVNAKDDNGWTPVHLVFIACDIVLRNGRFYDVSSDQRYIKGQLKQIIAAFLYKGSKVTEKDKHGASVLHYAAGTGIEEPLKSVLEECEEDSVNKGDNFGSTPLHYAAFNNRTENTQLLLEMGCKKDQKDHNERTAVKLAELMGYTDIVVLLSDNPLKLEIFNLKKLHETKSKSKNMNYDEFTELMKREANESNIDAIYTSLLKSPVLGSMKYQEKCFQEEAKLVRDDVVRLINCFSKEFECRYPLFAFTPKLRGSMAEQTKSGPPDEFDFMLKMNVLSDLFKVTAIAECKAHMTLGNLYDILPRIHLYVPTCLPDLKDFQPGHLNVFLFDSMKKYLLKLPPLEGSHLSFLRCDPMKVGVCLDLVFNGPLYKNLHISVDLVPCLPLKIPLPTTKHIEWPAPVDFSKCQLYGLLRDGSSGFDMSCTDYEEVLFHSLPKTAKEAYVLGKAIGSGHFEWCGKGFRGSFNPSYMMKKALLIAFQQHKDTQEVSRHEWLERIISVRSKLEEIIRDHDGHRCIFHADKWTPGETLRLNLSF